MIDAYLYYHKDFCVDINKKRGSEGHNFCLNTLDENILGQKTKKCG